MQHNKHIVLVTGCTDGSAGAALARHFHIRGCRVFAAARSLDKMQSLADLGMDTLAMDVLQPAQITAAVDAVRSATGGRLDILVNNAAVFNLMPLADQDLDDARAMFNVNVFGMLAVTQAFLPLLTATAAVGGRPLVANVGSISAQAEPVFQGIYAASKAAVAAMSGVMRKELAPLGIRVVTIVSGAVATNFKQGNKPWRVPEGSLYSALAGDIESKQSAGSSYAMEPDDYAKKVVGDLLGVNPGPAIFRGRFSSAVWLLSWFGRYGMLDSMEIRDAGLNIVKYPEI
ncbi:hypothetical protein PFICI_00861 [Pestalotiopsis fici W106-1]|uniref:Uncharacterized protein n=1 Tax=Pestalotiopsis fici (strain W106-1 / CGMCC3.15140) TaxID=1229662 RepID=W3XLU3_PESFW|nr:uncharacterized protein PFICI_00861 [Pestalotiopsis fici W106-1]ETS87033.1 hypothetical protein PFICI_00861 [Pestalotiopsis fici W106-1]